MDRHQAPLWRNCRGTPLLQIGVYQSGYINVPEIVWANLPKAFVLLDRNFTAYVRAKGGTRTGFHVWTSVMPPLLTRSVDSVFDAQVQKGERGLFVCDLLDRLFVDVSW